jgi:hypothetical protein
MAQFNKGMWKKLWGVWYKGDQCSMMSELKQIMILSLNFFVVASLPLDYKEVVESLVGALVKF